MALQRQILPQRWRATTSIEYNPVWDLKALQARRVCIPPVELSVTGPYDSMDNLWPQFCATLSDMPGLQSIVITHFQLGSRFDKLHALLGLKRPMKTFDVHLQLQAPLFITDELKTALIGAQFQLKLPNGQKFSHGQLFTRRHQPVSGRRTIKGSKLSQYVPNYGWRPIQMNASLERTFVTRV